MFWKIYSLLILTTIKIQNSAITPNKLLQTLCSYPFLSSPPPGNHWSVFIVLAFPEYHINGIMHYLAFEFGFFKLSIIHLRFIHNAVCISGVPITLLLLNSIPWYVCTTVYPFTSWAIFGFFPVFDNMNKAAMNSCVFMWT